MSRRRRSSGPLNENQEENANAIEESKTKINRINITQLQQLNEKYNQMHNVINKFEKKENVTTGVGINI